jgi:hypothetical protein
MGGVATDEPFLEEFLVRMFLFSQNHNRLIKRSRWVFFPYFSRFLFASCQVFEGDPDPYMTSYGISARANQLIRAYLQPRSNF